MAFGSATLAQLRAQGLQIVWTVEVLADDGVSWVNLNTPVGNVSYPIDYYAALVDPPTLTMRAENESGAYCLQSTSITLTNRPWNGQAYGFWDAPLPVSIRGKSFGSWYRRQLRVGISASNLSGDTESWQGSIIGLWFIGDIQTGPETATLELVSPAQILAETDASSIRDGVDPIRGMTIAQAMRRLVAPIQQNGVPAINVPDSMDRGTLPMPMVSHMGPSMCSAIDGNRRVKKWVPRIMYLDTYSADRIWVGFEVPTTSRQVSDGAVAYYRPSNNTWTVVVDPDVQTAMRSWVPCSIHANASMDIYLLAYRETLAVGGPVYSLGLFSGTAAAGYSDFAQSGGSDSFWPARSYMRHGVRVSGDFRLGTPWNYDISNRYYGEPLLLPFPQTIESLGNRLYPTGGVTFGYNEVEYAGYERTGDSTAKRWPISDYAVHPGGNASMVWTVSTPGTFMPAWRFFLHNGMSPPMQLDFPAISTAIYVYIGTQPGADWQKWQARQIRLTGGATNNSSAFLNGFGGTAPLFDRTITAWGLLPIAATSPNSVRILVAVVEWNEAESATDPGSGPCRLYQCSWDGTVTGYGLPVVTNLRWTRPTGGHQLICRIHTGYRIGSPRNRPRSYSILGVYIRKAKGPMYGLGVYRDVEPSSGTVIQMPEDSTIGYTGPVSGAPFDCFTDDPDDDTVTYCLDQANGQWWKITVVGSTVTYALANNAAPVHGWETWAPVPYGIGVESSLPGRPARLWFFTGPGPWGDTKLGDYIGAASSALRYVWGTYPLMRFATDIPAVIPELDLHGLRCWEALLLLMDLVPQYRLTVGPSGNLSVSIPYTGDTSPKILLPGDSQIPRIETEEIPVMNNPTKSTMTKPAYNVVECSPYGIQPRGEHQVTILKGAGSRFAGQFLVNVNSRTPKTVSITAKTMGNVTEQALVDGIHRSVVLFSWATVLPEVHCRLAVTASAISTAVKVYDLIAARGKYYCGDVEIGAGDQVQVGGGDWLTISSLAYDPASPSTVTINLSAQLGDAYPVHSDVVIKPQERQRASDGPNGVATLTVSLTASATDVDITLSDTDQVAKGMILILTTALRRVEYLLVVNVLPSGRVRVVRGYFGTAIQAWTAPLVVLGYVWTSEEHRLFPVGNTGLLFGVSMRKDPAEQWDAAGDLLSAHDLAERIVMPGDGVVVTVTGYGLARLQGSKFRAVDNASVTAFGRKVMPSRDNRFLDPVAAQAWVTQKLTEVSRIRVTIDPVAVPLLVCHGYSPGSVIYVDSPRMLPGTTVGMEVVAVTHDGRSMTSMLTLRSLGEVGRTRPEEPTEVGTGGPKGQEGEIYEP